jgi:hypothetical protein
MAYLPDLTAPSSWEREAERRRSRTFSVFIALFFALLLCAASAFATAVYLDGVKVDARIALDSDPKPDPDVAAAAVAADPQKALQEAWVAGRKAGYKKGVAAGKLQTEPARKKAYQRGVAAGRAEGREAGEKMGYSKGYQDASAKYQAAWDQANPIDTAGTATGATAPETAPTP